MLRSYLAVALRTVRRAPGYTVINVAGLAAGMACCLLILLFVQDELRYDRQHPGAERLYRLANVISNPNGESRVAITPAVYGDKLEEEYPDVEQFVRLHEASDVLVRRGERQFHEKDATFYYADDAFFDLFRFPLAAGNPETALLQPFSLVLTPSLARKYFGDEDPIGRTLVFNDARTYTVTGVLEEEPRRSHLSFDALLSMASLREAAGQRGPGGMQVYGPDGMFFTNWHFSAGYTYLRLRPGVGEATFESRLPGFIARNLPAKFRAKYRPFLQPVTAIHLQSDLLYDDAELGSLTYIYIFAAVALFTLLIACVNYINLATARSMQRAREVGMRKVLGARRRQLIMQFLGESLLLALLATAIALLLAMAVLPVFNTLAGKSFVRTDLIGPAALATLAGISLFVGFGAGAYPALYLARLRPVGMMSGNSSGRPGNAALRKGLVIFQFTTSIVLLIGTGVIYSQLDYFLNKDLGLDREHVVVMDLRGETAQQRYDTLKETMLRHPDVVHVTASSAVPGQDEVIRHDVQPAGVEAEQEWLMPLYAVDHDFLKTLGIELSAGRDFSSTFSTDSTEAYLINEAAAAELGWQDGAVGREFTWNNPKKGPQKGRVIGVVEDFHYQPLRVGIEPAAFSIASEWYNHLSVRIRPGNVAETLISLERAWTNVVPDFPFEYEFLDDRFAALYEVEERYGRIFSIFTLIALLVACLGLFGLASFMVARRTKEIAVRKVVGATTPQLALLLTRDFTRLVAVAFVVACPIAYLAIQAWLDEFAYHIELSRHAWIFLAAGAITVAVALITVGAKAVRTALIDPAESLKHV